MRTAARMDQRLRTCCGPERKEEWMKSILPNIRSYRRAPMPASIAWPLMSFPVSG
jgi:hypothetical protein